MTKKDYELIASVLHAIIQTAQLTDYEPTPSQYAEAFAVCLEQNNPRFDRNKFLQACGVTD